MRGRVGEGPNDYKEIRVLNIILRITPKWLRYEADPRHAEMLVQASGLQLGNSAVNPGQKPEDVDYEQILEDLARPSFMKDNWMENVLSPISQMLKPLLLHLASLRPAPLP